MSSMKMSNSRRSMVMAVAIGFLALTLGTPAFAGLEPLAVKNVSVSGGIVQVTVKNVSLAVQSSTVQVEAVVNGASALGFVPVVLLPGQTAVVSAAFTGSVSSVTSVGFAIAVVADMSDDPFPM